MEFEPSVLISIHTPSSVEGARPRNLVWHSYMLGNSIFVNISAAVWNIGQYLRWTILSLMSFLMKWNLMLMCFMWWYIFSFVTKAIVPRLSSKIVVGSYDVFKEVLDPHNFASNLRYVAQYTRTPLMIVLLCFAFLMTRILHLFLGTLYNHQ